MQRLLACWLLLLTFAVAAPAQVRLEGLVVDARTGVPVAQVHVQDPLAGTGSVTNENGRFRLPVPRLPATLTFRHVGYATQQVEVAEAGDLEIRLQPAQITLGEVLVVGDDFAASLIERVIRKKQQQRRGLQTVTSAGYTRLRLESRGEIVLLAESVFDAYWDARRGIREVVRSKRESGDFYAAFGLEITGPVPNLYDDRVEIGGLSFIGPLHPDALGYYVYTLARRREAGSQTIYDLYVTPRTVTENTFIGTLSILEEADVLVYAELRPARHVAFPEPVLSWPVSYAQQFAPVADSLLWWPVDLHAEGRVTVAAGPREERSAFLSITARLTDVRAGETLPAEPYAQASRVVLDLHAILDDRLFYRGEGIVPLSPREVEALGRLQGYPLTLASAFPAESRGGLLNAFRGRRMGEPAWTWPEVWGARFRFRYNRVDGLYRSVGITMGEGTRQVEGRLGQRSGRGRLSYYARGRRPVGPFFVEARYTDDVVPQLYGSRYPAALASLPALAGSSYFDWGVRVQIEAAAGIEKGPWQARLASGQQRWREAEQTTGKAPFGKFEPNPPLDAGLSRYVRADVRYATPEAPARLDAQAEATFFSLPDQCAARVGLRVDTRLPTLRARRFDPNTLRLRFAGGLSTSRLPVQEKWVLDGQLAGFAPFGVLHGRVAQPYAGTAYAALFWQHDFRTRPFELAGLWPLVGAGTGVAVRGAHARVWENGAPAMPVYHEVGLDVTRLFATPLRAGITRRLDHGGWYAGFGLDVRW